MRYVVTGGAGFIGSGIVRELAGGSEVVVFDDLSSGKLSRIEDLLESGDVGFIRGDISDIDLLRSAFESADGVFHQAAQISVQDSVNDPIKTDRINVRGTLNVLQASVDAGVRKVVLASSAAVYGDDPALPKREDMPLSPMSPYAVSKIAGENYCVVYSELYGLKTACLRYFNVFGPGQDPSSPYAAVIPKFIDAIAGGKRPVIYGDGEQTRDFIYVGDVSRANALAMKSDAEGVFNIASGESVSVNHLLELLGNISGCSPDPVYEPAKQGDVMYSSADVSKAGDAFGFRPQFSLKKGLEDTYLSFKESYS